MKNAQGFEITVWPRETRRAYIYDYSARITEGVGRARFYEGGGASIYRSRAKKRAICEAVERCCGSSVPSKRLKASYRELQDTAVDPRRLILFEERQYQPGFLYSSFDECKPIEWVEGFSLTTKKETLVPAFAVYLGYNQGIPEDERLFPTLSCGLAVERSYGKAILNSIFELIERDAAMLSWLRGIALPRLDLDQVTSKRVKHLVEDIKAGELRPLVCISTRDISVPSVIGVVYSLKQNQQPYASFGLATEMNIEEAALKSLEEALMIRNTLEFIKSSGQLGFKPRYAEVKTFIEHAVLYAFPGMRKQWRFLERGELVNTKEAGIIFGFQKLQTRPLDCLILMLKNIGIETISVEITNPLAEAVGLKVVRVILLGIHQMDFDHNTRFLGGERIKRIVQTCGERARVNSNPHPFA